MTRFTVVWRLRPQLKLAELWLAAGNRAAITAAADRLDRELAVDPTDKGDQLYEELRAITIGPLSVIFEIRDADRIVEVLHVDAIK